MRERSIYKKPARAMIPPATAPIAGRAVGLAAAPVDPEEAADSVALEAAELA